MSASLKLTPKYWCGDVEADCQLCNKPIGDTFIDGRTVMGPWANMCPKCHRGSGTGLGLGKGQRYQKQADGRWLKTG
jgi:hypothetical protein